MSDTEQIEAAKAKALAAAEQAKALALAAFEKAKSEGFFSHFQQYNEELIMCESLCFRLCHVHACCVYACLHMSRASPLSTVTSAHICVCRPWKRLQDGIPTLEDVKTEILTTLQMSPANPTNGFILYNVLGFWLGVTESLLYAVLGHGLLSLVWNGAFGYAIAYTLYWAVTCSQEKPYMFYSGIFLGLYVVFNVFMALQTLLYVVPPTLYLGKALCDVLMLVNGFKLYKDVIGPDGKMML